MSASPHDGLTDQALVTQALDGDRDALRSLVVRHQTFVFNVALKMFGNREDAEDLTQQVFTRVITSLRTFRAESAFSTWLYRITVNHFLKTRRRGLELTGATSFEAFFDEVERVPDEPYEEPEVRIAEQTVGELRVRCTTGMLMCLDREQRIIYILGAMFGLGHVVGSEVMGLTPANFRVRLHRARTDLYEWMNRRCGLVNSANPCRCHKKTRGFIKRGLVDPTQLTFLPGYQQKIEALSNERAGEAMEEVERLHEQVFLDHAVAISRSRIVDEILGNETVKTFFDLS